MKCEWSLWGDLWSANALRYCHPDFTLWKYFRLPASHHGISDVQVVMQPSAALELPAAPADLGSFVVESSEASDKI
jgi:hypothetical protein